MDILKKHPILDLFSWATVRPNYWVDFRNFFLVVCGTTPRVAQRSAEFAPAILAFPGRQNMSRVSVGLCHGIDYHMPVHMATGSDIELIKCNKNMNEL